MATSLPLSTTDTPPRLLAGLRFVAYATSVITILVGVLVLAGWMFDIPTLKSIIPGLATMKVNTALSFVLAGSALWLARKDLRNQRARRSAQVCALLVAVIAGLTLLEYLVGADLNIDQLLFKDLMAAGATAPPGRMAPTTAFNFVLLSVALLLLSADRAYGILQLLTLIALGVALLAFVGYVYGVSALYQIGPYSSVAIHTAITFALLCLGILLARADCGLMQIITRASAGGLIARRLLLPALIVPFLLGWLRLKGQQAGLYDTEFGISLHTLVTIIIFTVLIWWTASVLDRIDRERQHTVDKLTLEVRTRERAETELQRQAARAHVQAEVSYALAAMTRDYQAILDTAAQQLAAIIGDACIIRLVSDDGAWLQLVAWYHPDPEAGAFIHDILVGERYQRADEGLTGRTIQTGQPVYIPTITSEQLKATIDPKHWALLDRFTIVSLLIAPLRAAGHVIGAIVMSRNQPGRSYTDDDLTLLQDLADRVALAITNARLFQQVEHELAERTQMAEALREREHSYRTLLEQASDGIFVADPQGKYITVNPQACKMLGYTHEELLQLTMADVLPTDELAHTPVRIDELRAGKSIISERRLRRKDGTLFPVEISAKMLDDGRLQGIVRDITERKHLEAQLFQAQKMESIGQLAGGIAHDFNNMLSAIIGFIGSARDDIPQDSPAQHDLEVAEGAAWRAAGLTRQLLAFARKQIVEPHVLNLNTVIVELDKLLRRLIGEDIKLVTLPAADLGQIKADPGQIEQVIANLIVNARDAMPAGGRLTIETTNTVLDANYTRQHAGVTPGDYVMLAVSDTGSGMDAEVQQHIFEPFYTTKEVGKGTGLGLATCYGIVKQHGGNIWLYSEVGHGTTFKIYLPRVYEIADALRGSADDTPLPRGTETVLLVEDEPLVREVARHILQEHGYTVLEAGTGDDALRIVHAYAGAPIALLISDVVMPQMGGKALAEQVTSVYPSIKVLFISGYATDAIVHHGRLDPGTNFLSKPFTPAAFANKVRAVLDAAAANSPNEYHELIEASKTPH